MMLRRVLPTMVFLLGMSGAAHAQINPGDILVVDFNVETTFGFGALFSVDPTTGQRAILSDFADPAQGALGSSPRGVALGADGTILVLDVSAGTSGRGALFSVNPTTGQRTTLSDFGDPAQGALGENLQSLALGAAGNLLVVDDSGGTNAGGVLFSVNPTTGQRTILSDFGDPGQGALGAILRGVALGAADTILVLDISGGTSRQGALFSVEPTTGQRTVLSDFGDPAQGVPGSEPFGVALGADGTILVVDTEAGTNARGALFSVEPTTGQRTVLSDFGDPAQGALGVEPFGVALSGPVPLPSRAALLERIRRIEDEVRALRALIEQLPEEALQ
jgi:hypothetical protein